MQIKRIISYAITLCAFILMSHTSKADNFVGHAFDMASGELLYSEHHIVSRNNEGKLSSVEVLYRDHNEQPLASKSLAFNGRFTPDVTFNDHRTDNTVKVISNLESGSENLTLSKNGDNSQLQFEDYSNSVIDAGFNEYMKYHWAELIEGGVKDFEFLAIDHGRFITFEVFLKKKNTEHAYFHLKPSNMFIALLMDPVQLKYGIDCKCLKTYSGISNIEDTEAEGNFVVNIVYEYEKPVSYIY